MAPWPRSKLQTTLKPVTLVTTPKKHHKLTIEVTSLAKRRSLPRRSFFYLPIGFIIRLLSQFVKSPRPTSNKLTSCCDSIPPRFSNKSLRSYKSMCAGGGTSWRWGGSSIPLMVPVVSPYESQAKVYFMSVPIAFYFRQMETQRWHYWLQRRENAFLFCRRTIITWRKYGLILIGLIHGDDRYSSFVVWAGVGWRVEITKDKEGEPSAPFREKSGSGSIARPPFLRSQFPKQRTTRCYLRGLIYRMKGTTSLAGCPIPSDNKKYLFLLVLCSQDRLVEGDFCEIMKSIDTGSWRKFEKNLSYIFRR